MNELPKRKQNRLSCFDYNIPHPYFITICTADKRCVLGRVVGESIALPPHIELTNWGKVVDAAIREIPVRYPMLKLDKYVIMPNHLHLILWITETADNAPTISHVVQQMKGFVTKQLGVSIWQKSFHDHVIRGEPDYQEIWEYIENNPLKWTLDRYYSK